MLHLSLSRFFCPVLFLVAGWSQAAVPPEPARPPLRFLAGSDSSPTSQTGTVADGETYSINLEPPAKIGQTYGVSAQGDWVQTTSIPRAANKEKKTSTQRIRVELEARVQVAQVYPNGLPAVELYQVRRCEKFDDKGNRPVASAGSTILATTREGQPYYELDGKKVSSEILAALRAVIPVRDPLEPPADQVFGSDRPRAVGSSWGVRPEALQETWRRRGVRLSEEAVSGYTRLNQLVDFANTDCLELHCEVIYKNFVPPSTENFKVVQGSRRSSITVKVPQDGRTGPLERVTETETQIGGRQSLPKPSESPKPAEKKAEKKKAKDSKAENPSETTLYVDTLSRHHLRQVFQYSGLEP
jgi:hypothetical protein